MTQQAPLPGVIREETVTVRGKRYPRFILDLGRDEHGKRIRRSFTTLEDAETAQQQQAELQFKIGRTARRLKDSERNDAAKALAPKSKFL